MVPILSESSFPIGKIRLSHEHQIQSFRESKDAGTLVEIGSGKGSMILLIRHSFLRVGHSGVNLWIKRDTCSADKDDLRFAWHEAAGKDVRTRHDDGQAFGRWTYLQGMDRPSGMDRLSGDGQTFRGWSDCRGDGQTVG